MTRIYHRFEEVRRHIIEYREHHGQYPTTEEISRVFKMSLRSARKFLRQFFRELGE